MRYQSLFVVKNHSGYAKSACFTIDTTHTIDDTLSMIAIDGIYADVN